MSGKNVSQEEMLIQAAELLLEVAAKTRNTTGKYNDIPYAHGELLGGLLFRMTEGVYANDEKARQCFIDGAHSALKQWLNYNPLSQEYLRLLISEPEDIKLIDDIIEQLENDAA